MLKTFSCNFCQKAFKLRGHLRRHLKVHSGEKPYKCRFCDRCFSQSCGVKSHERIHTGEKPYKCQHCSKQFVSKSARTIHRRKCPHNQPLVLSQNELKTILSKEELNLLPEISQNINTSETLKSGSDLMVKSLGELEDPSSEAQDDVSHGVQSEHITALLLSAQKGGKQLTNHDKLTGEKQFCCSVCGKRFSYRATLKRHLLLHTGEKPFKCDFCDKVFSQASHKVSHQRVHTKEKLYQCSECDAKFVFNTQLTSHIDKAHQGVYATRKVLPSKKQSWLHIESVGDAGRAACGTPLGQYPCPECGKICNTRSQWVQHQRRHTGEKPFVCQYCDIRFTHSASVKRHAMTHHRMQVGPEVADKYLQNWAKKDSEPTQHICHLCGKVLSSSSGFRYHMTSHTDVKFKCSFCGKEFKDKESCNLHEKVHRGEDNHQCTYCGRKFPSKKRLMSHERIHTGEKPYRCQYCGRAFAQQAALIVHERSHTGHRPFKCSFCEKRFLQSQDLKRHERLHRGEKPYKCRYCDMRFTLKGSQTKHEKTHLKQSPPKYFLNNYQHDPFGSTYQ